MASKRPPTGDTIFASQLFTRQELVGRGAYGSVYKGIENATQQVVAIKVLNLDTEEEDVSDIQREIATLSQLKNCDSQNITRYHGSFLNGTKLWIVMDYAAGGSIRSVLQGLKKIEEKCIAVIAREVLQALGYLHKHGIIHRDIKAANILLTDEGRVQLCDFGVAGQVTMNSLKRNSFVGTPYWMAPEVIKEGQTYDYKADIWSLGITIYEIATGNPPFSDQEPMRAVSLIPKSRPAQLEGDWSPAMKEFVALCLHEEPNQRPSAEDLLKTKWIKSTSKNSLQPLKELVLRYEQFKLDKALDKDGSNSDIEIDHELDSFDMEVDPDAWRFDTAKTLPNMTPSRASSISRPSPDSKGSGKSPVLSTQDSGIVMQGRKAGESSLQKPGTAGTTSGSGEVSVTTIKAKGSPTSPSRSGSQLKQSIPTKTQPAPISLESHPLLRLFMNHKSASEEDVSRPSMMPQTQLMSAPMTLTIPSLEDLANGNGRLGSRSPAPAAESSATFEQFHAQQQHHQHHHTPQQPSGQRQPESARIPFGFNLSKPFKFDRRPSAPVLMGSAPGPEYPFHNHVLQRGTSHSPLTSPRALAPAATSSLLSNMHQRNQDSQDSDGAISVSKGSHSHEIIMPHQGVPQQSSRPSSTPASPAIPPTSMMGSLNVAAQSLATAPPKDASFSRFTSPRRPSPSPMPANPTPQPPQPHSSLHGQHRAMPDSRNSLPPAIPHRKASLDFSQTERYSHLRPSLPMRPPSAAALRSQSFHIHDAGAGSAPTVAQLQGEYTGLGASMVSGMANLSLQPINISEEKLPPFGHSAAHLRMLNALPHDSGLSNGHHRGSIASDRDGLSPASSVHSDQTFGQLNSASATGHTASSSISSTSSASSASVANSLAGGATAAGHGGYSSGGASGPGANVVLARPGLRTVGSSENFARRIRSASMLKRHEEQEGGLIKGLQPSRPPPPNGTSSGQQQQPHPHQQHPHQQHGQHLHQHPQQPLPPQGHFHQHLGYQQQQYSYSHEANSDMNRYRRASSPRRRSISMTNLNGGLSVIMIPPKKSSVDDYAPNPLLLPPSPSATRFIAPSSLNGTLSSSPLRPALHSMASSSSLSSSFGSMSGGLSSHGFGGGGSNGASSNTANNTTIHAHGHHSQHHQHSIHPPSGPSGSSSVPPTSSFPMTPSTSPLAHPQATTNNINSNNNSNQNSVSNNSSIGSSYHTVMNSNSHHHPHHSSQQQQQQQQYHSTKSNLSHGSSNATTATTTTAATSVTGTMNGSGSGSGSTPALGTNNAMIVTTPSQPQQQHSQGHHPHHGGHHLQQQQQQHPNQLSQHSQQTHLQGQHHHHSHSHPHSSLSHHFYSHHHPNHSAPTLNGMVIPLHLLMVTPEARPLQMDALRRSDDLLEELQMTVNDLSQWLEVFEAGIKSVRTL